ncbi:MAG: SWIB/MDM2 domain-containing protein [Agriterribacter sp.]
MAPLTPSATLGEVIGTKPVARTEAIKKIWDYIKKNKLQDATNKRNINADAKLKALFDGKSQVSMFDLAKIINKHLK